MTKLQTGFFLWFIDIIFVLLFENDESEFVFINS